MQTNFSSETVTNGKFPELKNGDVLAKVLKPDGNTQERQDPNVLMQKLEMT